MITYTTQGRSTILTGSTYEVRDTIKNFGGTWQPEAKGWKIGNSKLEALQAAIARHQARLAAKPAVSPAARPAAVVVERTTCRARGCSSPVYARGYCRSCGHDEL